MQQYPPPGHPYLQHDDPMNFNGMQYLIDHGEVNLEVKAWLRNKIRNFKCEFCRGYGHTYNKCPTKKYLDRQFRAAGLKNQWGYAKSGLYEQIMNRRIDRKISQYIDYFTNGQGMAEMNAQMNRDRHEEIAEQQQAQQQQNIAQQQQQQNNIFQQHHFNNGNEGQDYM